jgi:hypothetical protein
MDEFYIWNHALQPKLPDRLTMDQIVQLGIFAYKYSIPALTNQVTDMLRMNLASGDWQLQAKAVDDIYQAAPDKGLLREVIKAALGQLPRSSIDGEEWEKTFRNNPDLGWDYHKAGDSKWAKKDYLAGVCRFHSHEGIKRQEGLCDGCPYSESDCYPVWELDQNAAENQAQAYTEQPNAADIPMSNLSIANGIEPEPDLDEEEVVADESAGVETPLPPVNGIKDIKDVPPADDVRSESLYNDASTDMAPESMSEQDVAPKMNGHAAAEEPPMPIENEFNGLSKVNGNVSSPAPESSKLTKKQKKKMRRPSVSQAN